MAAPRADATLAAATDVARSALDEVAEPGTVGEHVRADMVGERLIAHYFDCTAKAYPGWAWMVTLARAPRQKVPTICETLLVPLDDALLAPAWVPYAERLQPGDLRPGDVTPYREDDPNLEAGFEATGDEDVDAMGFMELGLGRTRVLSRSGRETAAQRWYDGENGPTAAVAAQAPAPCSTCGYFVPMAGALRAVFGVCANEWSPSDGKVVSLDHGCGAHSEVDVKAPKAEKVDPPIVDEWAYDSYED